MIGIVSWCEFRENVYSYSTLYSVQGQYLVITRAIGDCRWTLGRSDRHGFCVVTVVTVMLTWCGLGQSMDDVSLSKICFDRPTSIPHSTSLSTILSFGKYRHYVDIFSSVQAQYFLSLPFPTLPLLSQFEYNGTTYHRWRANRIHTR
jgi:hypothetical protein